MEFFGNYLAALFILFSIIIEFLKCAVKNIHIYIAFCPIVSINAFSICILPKRPSLVMEFLGASEYVAER